MQRYKVMVVSHGWRALHKGTIYPLSQMKNVAAARHLNSVFEFDAESDEDAYCYLMRQFPDAAKGYRQLAGKSYLPKCRASLRP